jgi:succinate CoA transferase
MRYSVLGSFLRTTVLNCPAAGASFPKTLMSVPFPRLTPEEAASHIQHGMTVAFSGFTPAGCPKAIPAAIARRAEEEHAAGRDFQIRVYVGASTGPSLDAALANAKAISFRAPYQSDPGLRAQINAGTTEFVDLHVSLMQQMLRYGFLGRLDWAVVEACDVTPDGGIVLTTSVGATPTFLNQADKVLIELNRRQPATLRGMHDIYEPQDPPHRKEIPIYRPSDRIGAPLVTIPPSKIVGIVETDLEDECDSFCDSTPVTEQIGHNVVAFLASEMRAGRIPPGFLPLQSGVGDIANCVLSALGGNTAIPPFEMYTEVIQDAVLKLLLSGRCKFASTSALTLSRGAMRQVTGNTDFFRSRILMRPVEVTNNPEVIRRLGIISMNTAIEVDLLGNVNSTQVLGTDMMSGIGGSGDFTRNAYVSIFSCPSTARDGRISTIVPLVAHQDHSEHSVQVVVTEQGVADLRGLGPRHRARLIIQNCAHPDYRPQLLDYLGRMKPGRSTQSLALAFAMHLHYDRDGDMRNISWEEWAKV